MRRIIVGEFLTLDGVMEGPENWQFPFQSQDAAEFTKNQILASDDLLIGRKTYEAFAPFWPTQTHNEFGIADKLNNQPKYVVSSTMQTADWNNSTLIKANPIEEIARLKHQLPDGIIAMTGSRMLIHALMKANLIDEFQLLVYPLILGSGMRLFDGAGPKNFKLVDTQTFSKGVVLLSYQSENAG